MIRSPPRRSKRHQLNNSAPSQSSSSLAKPSASTAKDTTSTASLSALQKRAPAKAHKSGAPVPRTQPPEATPFATQESGAPSPIGQPSCAPAVSTIQHSGASMSLSPLMEDLSTPPFIATPIGTTTTSASSSSAPASVSAPLATPMSGASSSCAPAIVSAPAMSMTSASSSSAPSSVSAPLATPISGASSSSAPAIVSAPAMSITTTLSSSAPASVSAPVATPMIGASSSSAPPYSALPYSMPTTYDLMMDTPPANVQQRVMPATTITPRALPANGLLVNTFDRTHQVRDFTSNPLHANFIPSNAASVEHTPANVGFTGVQSANVNANANATTANMFDSTSSSQMNMLYQMQQQITRLELQLNNANARISENERQRSQRLAAESSYPMSSVASVTQPTYIYSQANGLMPVVPQTSVNMGGGIARASANNIAGSVNEQIVIPRSSQGVTIERQPATNHFVSMGNSQSATSITHGYNALPTNMQLIPQVNFEYSSSGMQQRSASTHSLAATSGINPLSSNHATLPRKLLDLPLFSGLPEDWPVFYASYNESTSVYNYTNFENHQRLNKCLKGEAKDTVKSLLIHPSNVGAVIEQLRFRYGRPEQLVRSQIKIVRDIPCISESAIHKLVPFATTTRNLTVFLQSIGEEKHLANPTLLEELINKLPLSKRLDWARYSAVIRPYPTIAHFSEWLSEVANFVQMIQGDDGREPKRRPVLHATKDQRAFKRDQGDLKKDQGAFKKDQGSFKCRFCEGDHRHIDCRRLLDSDVSERWKLVKRFQLCFSCISLGHRTSDCRRRKMCSINGCQKYHNKLLHDTETNRQVENATEPKSLSSSNAVLNCSSHAPNNLLFRVVPVTLYGANKSVNTYALLDEGSSITMMDASLVEELGLKCQRRKVEIQWFGGKAANEEVAIANVFVSGLGMKKRHILRNVHGIANLSLPMQSLSQSDICNADRYQGKMSIRPYENVTPKVLIGLDHCHLGLPTEPVISNIDGPIATVTELGICIFGPSKIVPARKPSCLHVSASDLQMHDMIKEYFSTESFGVRAAPSIESAADIRAKELLESTTVKVDGHFQTGLLWANDNVQLPESYSMALRRLEGIERKIARNKEFGEAYNAIIKSYVEKGYARKLQPSELAINGPRTWYLPHFAVVNPHKPGKVRFVFDAAATSHGVSLNSQLMKGPQEYRPLVSVLFHFREGAVAVCADIQEMFHQVVISPEDRCAQRFLWRNGDGRKAPDVYEMTAMIFGAACSPCSAHYVKVKNAMDHTNHDPRAVRAITDYHYVDDYVDSFCSAPRAIEVAKQVREIHKDAGFQLCKFRSNCPDVATALGGGSSEMSILPKEAMESGKVLGMLWQPSGDYFTYRLEFHGVDPSVINGTVMPTKRMLLSVIMSIFDPLGFLCHLTITAKVMMREIWKRDLNWDEPIPSDVDAMWVNFRKQLLNAMDCKVPRHYFQLGQPKSLQLHIFVDASEDAFGAVAFWRSQSSDDTVEVSLVFAKTRSAPLRTLSIPRLELQAAVLGSRMLTTITQNHTFPLAKYILWSDSKTVLKWLSSEHCRYKPFVAHRIAEILNVTRPSDWRWVPTKNNVADEATRVKKEVNLDPSSRWFTGPSFLYQAEEKWPVDNASTETIEEIEELRPKYALLSVKNRVFQWERFSSFLKLKRAAAWVLRFVNNCRSSQEKRNKNGLTALELDVAERLLCRHAQRDEFFSELTRLQSGLNVPMESSLYKLTPCIDSEGLLRINGRLNAVSWLSYEAKRPIILPPSHIVTKLMVAHEHKRMIHQNTEAVICMIRQRYWVPNLRRVIRGVIASCNTCKLKRARPVAPMMGLLPEDRVTPYVRPFTYTGLDYFGPVSVSVGRRTEKRWVALFTCLTVRAIHLEVAYDLSTDACILAMRNFMNRRGVPSRIRSDNGKNFVGAAGEVRRFSDVFDCGALQGELASRGIEWVFNCPENPSEGGVWERMVQCVKKVLRHTMKEVSPKEHTFHSLLVEAEIVVNSRPLTHLPVTPEQEEPLTPNHFLLGSANTAQTRSAAEPDLKLCSLRKQWRVARQLRDRFWKKWVEEYLPTLVRRVKWCAPTEPLQEGDLVFICDAKLPRKEWRRGRVEKVYPGKDGQVRRADVSTSTGMIQRSAFKLAKLDVDCGESASIHGGGGVNY